MGRSTDLYRFLDTIGDGTGDKNANGNYSSLAKNFIFECPADCQYVDINRMIVYLEDSGNFAAGGYGSGSALTNGVDIKLEKKGETINLTDGVFVKSNIGWSELCHDVNYLDFGSGNNGLSVRWTFGNSGKPVRLYPGEKFIALFEDDLTPLIVHTYMLQGQYTW